MTAVKALVFDVFGTVVDWRGSIVGEVQAMWPRLDAPAFADAWRAGYVPAMDRTRRGEIAWTNIDGLHRTILDEIRPRFGLGELSEPEVDRLNRVWHRLNPWPDVVSGLRRLKTQHVIATLSNGNTSLLVNMAKHAGLPWDCILSAENVRHYKPDLEVYLLVPHLFELKADQVMMVAAHEHDLQSASKHGLRTAFVHRPYERGAGKSAVIPSSNKYDIVATDFLDLASQLAV